MKKYLFLLALVLFSFPTFAQEDSLCNVAKKTTIQNYLASPTTELEGNRIRVLLHFDFG